MTVLERRKLRRFSRTLSALLVVMFTVGLTGCAKKTEKVPTEAGIPKSGGILRFYIAEPNSIDPAHNYESEGIQVGKGIFDGLVDYDTKTLAVVPAIAESWQSNDEATVFTFKLKQGVKFHNGREVKAQDFVYSWSRIAAKVTASELSYHLDPIEGFGEVQAGKTDTLSGVRAVDDYTLEVTLRYPYAEFLTTLGHPVFSVVPKEEVEKWGDDFGEHPVGAGPFKFVKWKHDQEITLKRFDDYYGQKAHLDKVVYKIFAEDTTAMLEFKAGNLDYTQIPIGQVKSLQDDPQWKDQIINRPLLSVYYYGVMWDQEPWKDNPDLRKALAYLVDRESICQVVGEGIPTPATGFVPRGIPGFQEKAMLYTYDLDKAKEHLIKAGYPEGKSLPKLKLAYNTGVGHDKIAQAIQASAKEVGINFDIAGYEWVDMLNRAQAGELNFFRLGWAADYPTMDNFLYPNFYSKSADNYIHYSNSEVDRMLIEARGILDEVERQKKYQEIERKIMEDCPVVPIYFYGSRRIVQPYVKGLVVTAFDDVPVELVWLEK